MYVCYNKLTGIARAVKVLTKSALDKEELSRIMGEVSILKMMDHPNVVRLYEIYHDNKRYYLVTE